MKRLLMTLLIALLLPACTAAGQPGAAEIVQRAQQALDSLDRAHAVVEAEATVDGESYRVVGEGWMAGEQKRAVVLEASQPELVGTLAVSDGTRGWLYHPDHDRALTGNLDELEAYRESHADGAAGMDFQQLTGVVDELLQITDQSLVGSERVGELEAWHLRLTPNSEAPTEWSAVGGVLDLWVSKEYDVPLQLVYSGGTLGEGRVTVRQYEPAAKFGDELFTFTPPAGVTVTDVATLLPETMTLTEARAAAPFPLLSTPADTAEATLVALHRLQESYVQEFDGTLGEWTLWQGETLPTEWRSKEGTEAGLQLVEVRGHKAELRSDPEKGWSSLSWREPGFFVTISGPLAPDEILALAQSLE